MGRKINSNLLKKNKYDKWSFNYLVKKKEETSFFFFKNYVIYQMFQKLFFKYQLYILDCKIYQTPFLIHIFISYSNLKIKKLINPNKIETSLFINKILLILNNYIKYKLNFYIILQNLIKYFIQLKLFLNYSNIKKTIYTRYKKYEIKYKFIKSLLKIFILTITKSNSAQFLSNYISYLCKIKIHRKHHLRFLKLFKTITSKLINSKVSIVSGIKIILSGRLNGFSRSRSRFITINNMPLNSYNVKISYGSSISYTINGTLGIKVWIYEK